MARMWLVVKTTLQPLYRLEKQPVQIVQDAWWATGRVCMEVENITPTGV